MYLPEGDHEAPKSRMGTGIGAADQAKRLRAIENDPSFPPLLSMR
jgi:hypothetical protein